MPIQQHQVSSQGITPSAPINAPPAARPGIGAGDIPPQTPAEYNALLARLTQLRDQLSWLQGQRVGTANRFSNRINSDAYRAGLDARLQSIDAQILQVDASIAHTNQLLAQAPASALPATATVPPPYLNQRRNNDNQMAAGVFISALAIVFVIFPLTIALIRRIGRGRPAGMPPRFEETPARLERLEQSLDAVAIEVERISESQRFMTRLMTETQLGSAVAGVRASAKAAAREVGVDTPAPPSAKALGPGEAPFEPVRVGDADQAALAVPATDRR